MSSFSKHQTSAQFHFNSVLSAKVCCHLQVSNTDFPLTPIEFGFRNLKYLRHTLGTLVEFFFSSFFFHKFDCAMSPFLRLWSSPILSFRSVTPRPVGLRALGVKHPSDLLTRASQGHFSFIFRHVRRLQ